MLYMYKKMRGLYYVRDVVPVMKHLVKGFLR